MAEHPELHTVELMLKLWPVLMFIVAMLCTQAVALYRINQNSIGVKENKTATEGTIKELELRLRQNERQCERIDNIEGDVDKIADQQRRNSEVNLTIKTHENLCDNASLRLAALFNKEFAEFQKALFAKLEKEHHV